MLLADHLVERLRAQRIGKRRDRLRASEEIGAHLSPRTSAPFGGPKRNSLALTCGLRTSFENRSTVVCPKLSVSCIASRPSLPTPMRTRSKQASRSSGLAPSHPRPALSPDSDCL